jgi:hypothetical protein
MRTRRTVGVLSAVMVSALGLITAPASSAQVTSKNSFVECVALRSIDTDTAYGRCTNSRTSANGRARLKVLCVGTTVYWMYGAWIPIPNHSTRNLDKMHCTSSSALRADYDSELVLR